MIIQTKVKLGYLVWLFYFPIILADASILIIMSSYNIIDEHYESR